MLAKRPWAIRRFNSGEKNAEVSDVAPLSRPYQIALGAMVVLALVWAMALRNHGSSPSEPASSTPATTPAKTVAEAKPGAPTPVYHGAAPGVEGLTKAIAKAHGAVATSEQNARQLGSKSSEASDETRTSSGASVHVAAKVAPSTAAQAASAAVLAREQAARARRLRAHAKIRLPPAQVAVERELAQGKTVMLVFWDPRSSVDREVRSSALTLVSGSKGTVTMHVARANQVGTFGSITEVANVYQTPTILIVNRHGVVSTLTGLTDVFALKQAVHEARIAGR
jgi:hypothetical protein